MSYIKETVFTIMRTSIIFDDLLKTLFMKNFVSECKSSERIQISHWKDPDG